MNVDQLSPVLVVVLGVLAISATAASMDSTAPTTEIGAGGGSDAGSGDAAGAGYSDSPMADLPEMNGGMRLAVFDWVRLFLIVAFSGGTLAYLVYVANEIRKEGIRGVRSVLTHAITTIVPVAIAGIALIGPRIMSMAQSKPVENPSRSPTSRLIEGGGSSSVTAAVDATTQLLPLLLLVLGLAVAVGLVALAFTNLFDQADDEREVATADGFDAETEPMDVVNAGPRNTLDDAEASNAVYRAWRELATAVEGANPRTHTPTEVAVRAVEHDYDRQAVQTLTRLFEEVRYGQRPATSERESAAQSALDSLESDGESE